MKGITNEIKIAIVAILGIVVLFFGMQFLKGLDLFSNEVHYNISFNDVNGLAISSPITANGVKIGTVKSIEYDYEHPGKPIIVGIDVIKDMRIPQGTTAEIQSDLMNNIKVQLIMPQSSASFLSPGSTIPGNIASGIMGEAKDLVPTIKKMVPKLDSIVTSINALLADPALSGSLHNIHKITSDLTVSTKELNSILAQVDNEFPQLASKANGFMDHADNTISTANDAMGNAKTLITNLNEKVDQIDVQATMDKVNHTLANIQQLTDKLNSNEGSLGLLMNDPNLYHNLNKTMQDADSLVVNLKAHPKRYVHFSLFGKKDR